MAEVGHIKQCVAADETGTCTQEAWMPPPQLLPDLSAAEVGMLLGATAVVFAVSWAWKMAGRTTRD